MFMYAVIIVEPCQWESKHKRKHKFNIAKKKVFEVIKFITNLFSFDTSEKKRLNKRKKRKENTKFNEKNTWILSWRQTQSEQIELCELVSRYLLKERKESFRLFWL